VRGNNVKNCWWHRQKGTVSVAMKLIQGRRIIPLVSLYLLLAAVGAAQSLPPWVAERFEAAREAEKSGDYRGAAVAYEAIVKRYPLAQAYNNLGLDYFRLKQFRLAVRAFRDGLKLEPNMLGAQLFLGLSEYSLGNFKASAKDLHSVLNVDGKNQEAWLYLIRSEAAMARFHLPDGQMAIETFPRDPKLNYAVGSAALEQIKLIAHEANQMGSSSTAFLWIKLREAEGKGNILRAADFRRRIQQAGVTAPPIAIKRYDRLTNLVHQCFENTLETAPKSPYAHRIRGQVYEAQGLDKQALQEYRQGKDHFAAGRLLAQDLQFKDAEKELGAAIGTDPLNRLASALLAQLYVKEHSPDKAVPILRSLLREYPEDAYAWADLGKAQTQLGQNEAAVNSLRKALELDASMNELRYEMAMIYRNLGRAELAKEQLKIFLRHSKKNPNSITERSSHNEEGAETQAGTHQGR
jgi:tetratricopeptide (TPR) repeat protein